MGNSVFTLDGEVAVVTGARGRLGPIWIGALLDAGAVVAALDLPDAPASEEFRALAAKHGERLRSYDGDVTDRAMLDRAGAAVAAEVGPPTVLVNNAGIDQPPDSASGRFPVDQLPISTFRRMLDVNLAGAFQVTQVFGGMMAERGRGSVINIGSLYASVSPDQRFYSHFPGDPPFLKMASYGASKAGLVNLTKYFATVWGSRGVRVNTLSPGGVLGGQDAEFRRKYCERVPLGRMAVAADLVGPLVFLASRASSYVTGVELRVDGGFTAW
jgi:NAD(P)-dependent dehydrogenase (short-subunit alcohol dehydrogenase family)